MRSSKGTSKDRDHENEKVLRHAPGAPRGEAGRAEMSPQIIVIACGVLLIVLTGVLPPWAWQPGNGVNQAGPYSPIWLPPRDLAIDTTRLGIEWTVIAALTALLFFLLRRKS